MRARRQVVAGLGVAGVLALAGCGGVGGSSGGDQAGAATGSGSSTAKPASISTMGFGLPDEIAKTRVSTFEKASGINVKVIEGGFDEQQFLSAVASGNPPDLIYLDRNIIGTYAARGAIQPLDDCVKDQKIDMSQYRDPAVQQVTVDGKVYGIPEFYSVRVVVSNDAALDKAGVTPEEVSSGDWSQIAAANKKLTKASGGKIQRIGYDPKLPEFLPLWAHANGARLLSEDGKTAKLDDPKVAEALDFAVGLVKQAGSWSAYSAFKQTWDFFGAKNEYVADQLGAMPIEDWYVNTLAKVSPDATITASEFHGRDGKPLTYATGSAWAVPKGAAHKQAACEFAKTMTAPDTWVAAAKAKADKLRSEGKVYTGTYTGNKVADERIFTEVYKPSGHGALDHAVEVVHGVQDAAFSMPPSPAGAEVEKAWTDAVVRVLQGQQSSKDALAQAQQEAQKALDAATKG